MLNVIPLDFTSGSLPTAVLSVCVWGWGGLCVSVSLSVCVCGGDRIFVISHNITKIFMLLTILEQRVPQGITPAATPTKNHLCIVQHFPILQYKVSHTHTQSSSWKNCHYGGSKRGKWISWLCPRFKSSLILNALNTDAHNRYTLIIHLCENYASLEQYQNRTIVTPCDKTLSFIIDECKVIFVQ